MGADRGEVRRNGGTKSLGALVGQHRVGAAAIGLAALASHVPGAFESVHQARDPAAAQQHAVGQLAHAQPLLTREAQL